MKKALLQVVALGTTLYGWTGLPEDASAQFWAKAQPQREQRTVDANPGGRPQSLKRILNELESRYKVTFAFDESLLQGKQGVMIPGRSLEETLNQLLTPQGLRYRKVKENIYVVLETEKSSTTSPLKPATDPKNAVAQVVVRKITGTVTDEAGVGLPGANVLEEGTSNGTSTDGEGKFTLNVSDNAKRLVISSIGYQAQTVDIGASQSAVTVRMREDTRNLDEVVVVSYGTAKRANLTEAVSTVNMAEAKKIQAASVADQIQGRLAGVTVSSSGGQPGAVPNIKIRGTSTLSGNDGPIYVIDGVIIGSAAADFNPNDIETFTVLKDAAATALYGSRGMNGAVIITTRRGKSGAPRIEYSGYYGVQNITKRLPLANAAEFRRIATLAYQNAGRAVPNFRQGVDTDWQDALIKTGAITDHNLSFSGGSEFSKYYVSAGYFDQQGTIVGPWFKRYSARVNSDITRGRFSVGESVYLAYVNQRRVVGLPFDEVPRMLPTIPVYDPNRLSGFGYGDTDNNTFGTNPVGMQLKDDDLGRQYKILGNVYGSYKFTDWLSYRLSLSLDYSNYQDKYFARPGGLRQNNPELPYGTLNDRNGRFFNTIVENTLNFNRTFGKHGITALLGYTRQRDDQNYINTYIEGINGEFYQNSAGTLNARTDGRSAVAGLVSYLGRINYDFGEKYFVQLNVRRDASSRFPRNNRVAYFPSASVAWRVSQEPFMQNVTAIGDLKLRASYGTVGNQAIRDYQLAQTIDQNLNYVLGSNVVGGAINRQLINSDLRWESKATANIGVDLSLLSRKLQITADYFQSKTSNILLQVPIPISAGSEGDRPYNNLASLQNRGFELGINYNNRAGGFEYSVGANVTSIRNKALGLVPENGNLPIYGWNNITRTEVGGPIAGFYVLERDGIFQNQTEIDKSAQRGTNVTPGDIRWKDNNGDGQINFDDRRIIGTPFPKFEYGLNLAARYKGFDATIFFQGVAGNLLFNQSRYWTERFDDAQNYRTDVTPWTGPGTSNITPKPKIGDGTLNPTFSSDRWVESGAYGRLRTFQIGYTVPAALLNKLKMSSARVYLNAQNIFTLTKYTGYNPDVVGANGSSDWWGRGIDVGNYPVPRTASVGLQVGF